jgi:hypothetical protein
MVLVLRHTPDKKGADMTKGQKTEGQKIGEAVTKGYKATEVQKGGEFSLLSKDGKRRISTLSPRADYCILERVPKGVKVGGLKAAGQKERGRWIVTEADVPTAKEIIAIAMTYKPEPIEKSATQSREAEATEKVSHKVTESKQKPQPRKAAVSVTAV